MNKYFCIHNGINCQIYSDSIKITKHLEYSKACVSSRMTLLTIMKQT